MKVVYPKNIKKWLFAGMTFSIGPLSVSIVQLFILAVGVAIALAVFNNFAKGWSRLVWIIFALFILWIFIVIAFFKISELSLVPFIAKMVRNNFFDTKKKFQENYTRESPVDVIIKESKAGEEKQIIERKAWGLSQKNISEIEKWGLV